MHKIISKYVYLFQFALLLPLSVLGQYTGFTSLQDEEKFRTEFMQRSSAIASISSDFTQEKVLSALEEKITSYGSFKFKRDNKVRIEYTRPFRYLMIMNGDKLLVRENGKESSFNVRSSKLFQQVNRIMLDCVQGTILGSKDFTANVFENREYYLLEMRPVSKSLKDFFETIVLTVDRKDGSVSSIRMNEPSGDYTTMLFSNKTLNATISDQAFSL